MPHAALTAAEVSALLGVDEKVLRKEIEVGVFDERKPVRFSFAETVYLWTMNVLGVRISVVDDRRKLWELIDHAMSSSRRPAKIEISDALDLRLGALVHEVEDRLKRFDDWKQRRVVEDPNRLAGEPTFKGRRLSVRKIGEMLLREDCSLEAEVREDYPYLSDEDIDFAPRFAKAYPRRGRPREAPAR